MYYAKVRTVEHSEAVKIIETAIAEQHISRLDLVKMIGYPFIKSGLLDVEKFFSGENQSPQLRIKIGTALGIDHEQLTGERPFEDHEKYHRYMFSPYLLRVPENTRPSQITFLGFLGFDRCFVAGIFPWLLNASLEEQKVAVKKAIAADLVERPVVPFFGMITGYAFYPEFGKPAIPFSIEGTELLDMKITYIDASCNLSINNSILTDTGRFRIPRLTARNAPQSND